MSLKPELYDSDYLDDIVHQVWEQCIDKDCDSCPHKNELDILDDGTSVCKTDILLELWRRWQNARSQKRHAHWIQLHPEWKWQYRYYQCSACGRQVQSKQERCPKCLARMDECHM